MFPVACYPKMSRPGNGGGASFVGPLDTLMTQGAVLRHASSVRRLLGSYTGSAIKLRGNGIGTLADIAYLEDGSLDLSAAAALATADGGTMALWHTAYDQAGIVNAVQTTDANQMEFSTSVEAKGAMGGGAIASTWLNLNLGTITQPSFFSIVANVGATGSTRSIFGVSSGASPCMRLSGIGAVFPQQSWGTFLNSTTAITLGKHLFGFLSNGATSKIFIDGALDIQGNANTTLLNLSTGRIGSSNASTANWNNTAGNTISEVIVFDGDPTGLAGWTDFVTAQKAYFGIA